MNFFKSAMEWLFSFTLRDDLKKFNEESAKLRARAEQLQARVDRLLAVIDPPLPKVEFKP